MQETTPNQIREEYHINFQELISSLNPQQRQAVQQTEGPVLALAGPGTGKTHILSARIGQILLHSDTQAYNILCLTFTDAAVNAMRKRLLQFIGPEAHRVHIYTFHSFCNKVIQENLDVFGMHDLEPLSDLERIDIVRTMLQQLDVEHPLRKHKKSPYYYERHLSNLFKQMKSERWTEDYLRTMIDKYTEELPQRPEMRYKRKTKQHEVGDLKEGLFTKKIEQMDLLRQAVVLFSKYQHALRAKKRYDYEDMILWVIKAFEQEEHLLRRYQEQYLYFLIDEFQDTNGSQNAILQTLVNYWGENPNLFVVGDDDQSIYEFQGARVQNMTDFYHRYEKHLLLVLLQQNYRSSQKILDSSKQSIDHNTIRLLNQIDDWNLDKSLQAANPSVAAEQTPVQVVAYPNKLQEEVALVQQIESLQVQGVELKDIAVIYALHRQASNIIRLLDKRNIPYQTKRKVNVLELPIIINLRKIMSYIVAEYYSPYSGEDIFFEFLHYDFVGISPSDANKLVAWKARATEKCIQKNAYEKIPTWHDTIRNRSLLEQIGIEDLDRLAALGQFFDRAIYDQKNSSILKLFELIINQSGLIQYIAKHPQKAWLTQIVGTLFEFIRQERTKNPKLDLELLLDLFVQLEENNIGLGLFKVSAADNGVNLVTAHSAKGLEFEYVFMIHGLKDYWEPRNNNHLRLNFPDTITYSNESDTYEAARRLFYVAMTRAKKQLQISYYQNSADDKEMRKACFLDEIIETTATNSLTFSEKEADNIGEWQLLLLSEQEEKAQTNLLPSAYIDELLASFKLSVSALNNYIYCPLGFYYEYVLRVPSFSSTEAAYGTAIHNALKRIFDIAMRNEKKLPATEVLIELFELELERQGAFLPKEIYDERLELGKRHLPLYYKQRKEIWNQLLIEATVLTEKPLKNVVYKGVPLTGTIDKLLTFNNQEGKYIEVVDYKTGKLDNKRLVRPNSKNIEGGTYWRQLVFYKILVDSANISTTKVKKAAIDYLTPDFHGKFPKKTVTFSNDDVQKMGLLIENTYKNIMNHNFSEGCNRPNCKWCNFTKRNMIPSSFSNEQTEILDDKSK